MSGAVKGSTNFDGSNNITITTTQDNITTISKSVTLSNGYGLAEFSYPSGFNQNNCIVIAVAVNGIYNSVWTFYSAGGLHILEVGLATNKITIECNSVDEVGSNKAVTLKAILMKI